MTIAKQVKRSNYDINPLIIYRLSPKAMSGEHILDTHIIAFLSSV